MAREETKNQYASVIKTDTDQWNSVSLENAPCQKDMVLKDEFPSLVSARYDPEEEWTNSSRKNEEPEQKWEKNAQLWMWLVMEVKSDAVDNRIA